MQYRRLGRTELDVSVVGVGTWQFGGEWGRSFEQAEADAILGRARELGINLVDTAECYGDHLSEELVGRAIRGTRDEWVVATKFGHRFLGPFQRTEHWSAREVVDQLEASLTALGTDRAELYQFHSGTDEVFDNDELWEALRAQVQAGKVLALGVSIGNEAGPHQPSRARELGAGAIQLVYNRLERSPEQEILPICARDDLGVLARVPLASGFLSGKYAPGSRFTDPGDVRSRAEQDQVQARLAEVARIAGEEVPEGVDMATWALAWCLREPAVSTVIPGCKSVAQVEANARAGDLLPAS